MFREEQDMPYIEVDEVPEGTEAVDVVLRSEYDAVVQERNSTAAQRDEALQQIEEAHAEVRKVKERYADCWQSYKCRQSEIRANRGTQAQDEHVRTVQLKEGKEPSCRGSRVRR